MSFDQLYMCFMAACFLISLAVYRIHVKELQYLKLFPPILFITLVIELIGLYMGMRGRANITMYNFFSVFWICYYLFILSAIVKNKTAKRIIWGTIVAYMIAAVVNILFIQGKNVLHTVTYSLGLLLIVFFCIYYFFELFRHARAVDLKRNPAFWICSGLLFYCCCGFPLYGFINVWAKVPFIVKSFQHIVSILNIFLYTLLSIGFLCSKTRKYTLS
jgi:hypothetical protein